MDMNAREKLRLLSVFHFVVGSLCALFSCIPLVHFFVGLVLFLAGATGSSSSGDAVPAMAVGGIFIVVAVILIAGGWLLAAAIVSAGFQLRRRRHHTFCLVVAGIECVFMPLGTVLGVLTILALLDGEVRSLFED